MTQRAKKRADEKLSPRSMSNPFARRRRMAKVPLTRTATERQWRGQGEHRGLFHKRKSASPGHNTAACAVKPRDCTQSAAEFSLFIMASEAHARTPQPQFQTNSMYSKILAAYLHLNDGEGTADIRWAPKKVSRGNHRTCQIHSCKPYI